MNALTGSHPKTSRHRSPAKLPNSTTTPVVFLVNGWRCQDAAKNICAHRRSAVPLRILTAAYFLSVGCAFVSELTSAQEGQQKAGHPYIEQNDVKTETCLRCHPHEQEGKFVHSAMASGCESCHQTTSDKETLKTTITLTATGGDLCAMCHEATKDPVVHGPVKAGQCLTCHDPHASEFKAQMRADGNELCLACHAPKRTTTETVVLFKSVTMSDQDFQAVPKIALDPTRKVGHPWARHPVGDCPNPLNPNEKMSCLSCHQPHSSTEQSLIIPSPKGKDLCDTCHQAFEEQKKVKLEKLDQAQIEQHGKKRQGLLNQNVDEKFEFGRAASLLTRTKGSGTRD